MKRINRTTHNVRLTTGILFLALAFQTPVCADSGRATLASVEKLFLEGRYQDVIDIADRFTGSRSTDKSEVYYLAGISELKLGRSSDARQSFQDIISDCPGCPRAFDAYVGLGDAYLLEGNPAAAITVYDNTLAAFPDHRNTAVVYYRLSEAYAKAGDAGKSQYYFDSAKLVAPLAFEAKSAPVVVLRTTQVVPATSRPAAPAVQAAPGRVQQKPEASAPEKHVSIQVASFKNKDNANKFVDRLSVEGFDSHAESAQTPSGTVYRVRVGKFLTRDDARATVARLRDRGYAIKLCTDELCE